MDESSFLAEFVAWSLIQCKTAITTNSGSMVSLFLAGLAGSGLHCLGMCGPFVFSQIAARLESVPLNKMSEFQRLKGAALLPYHLGRTTTYTALGVAAASLTGGLNALTGLSWLAPAALLLGAIFFLGYALRKLNVKLPGFGNSSKESNFLAKLPLKSLFAKPLGWRGYALGLVLGFIPCGLLYGALAIAASSGDEFSGFFLMLSFALGTMPALIITGLLGQTIANNWKTFTGYVAPLLLIANAGFLAYLAFRGL